MIHDKKTEIWKTKLEKVGFHYIELVSFYTLKQYLQFLWASHILFIWHGHISFFCRQTSYGEGSVESNMTLRPTWSCIERA